MKSFRSPYTARRNAEDPCRIQREATLPRPLLSSETAWKRSSETSRILESYMGHLRGRIVADSPSERSCTVRVRNPARTLERHSRIEHPAYYRVDVRHDGNFGILYEHIPRG